MSKFLTEAQANNLEWLAARGGSGILDQYARVVAGGEVRSLGSWTAWMKLVSKGCITGGEGRIWITEEGRKWL